LDKKARSWFCAAVKDQAGRCSIDQCISCSTSPSRECVETVIDMPNRLDTPGPKCQFDFPQAAQRSLGRGCAALGIIVLSNKH
jgi:hypothetical protein